jgi:hypothetical protein
MTRALVPYLLPRRDVPPFQADLAAAMVSPSERTSRMNLRLIGAAFAVLFLPVAANAQVTIDMSALTCEQYLAMSPSRSRDFSAWMSGWYSYQTRRRVVDVLAHQKNIEGLKSWCQLRRQESVMAALQSVIGPQ